MDHVGTEITGLSSEAFGDPTVAAECLRLLDAHGVVVYRDAALTDAELVGFSRMLGEVVVPPAGGDAEHPEVAAISLDPSKDAHAAFRRGTFFWHIDGANDDVPQKATLLVGHEVADEGGDTEFASTFAAYDALTPDEKAEISSLRVIHSFAASQRLVTPDPSPKLEAAWEQVPVKEHPLVWTRPDGRKSLLVGASAAEVVGMAPDEGRELLDRLLAWCTKPAFVFRHRWHRGDLVVWDNTGMLHRAIPYAPTSRRLLHRTTLVGEFVVA